MKSTVNSLGLDDEREVSDRIGDSTTERNVQVPTKRTPEKARAHMLDFIEMAVGAARYTKFFIPAVYLSAAAVDTAQPLGRGGSFIVTLRKIPNVRPTTHVRHARGADATYHPEPKPIPPFVVYKTAYIEFEESGFTHAEYEDRFKSVLLELSALTHPPLLHHPNIIDFLGVAWGNNPFNLDYKLPVLVVEYAEHGTLADLQSKEILSSNERRWLCLDVALGLRALHQCGIVHGDVKSLNVLVFPHSTKRYIAKLADFGFSVVETNEEEMTLSGHTFPWNAPESNRLIPKEQLKLTDVYSLGLLIWVVALDGSNPFDLIIQDVENRNSAISHLKATDGLIPASRLLDWYPKWDRSRHLRDFSVDDSSEPAPNLHSLSLSPSNESLPTSIQQAQCDVFYQKLDEIFDLTLTAEPTRRRLDSVIERLQGSEDTQ